MAAAACLARTAAIAIGAQRKHTASRMAMKARARSARRSKWRRAMTRRPILMRARTAATEARQRRRRTYDMTLPTTSASSSSEPCIRRSSVAIAPAEKKARRTPNAKSPAPPVLASASPSDPSSA